jgi:hypothetical protein
METAANRKAQAGCVAAAARHSVPVLRTPAIANRSRTHRTIAARTNQDCRRRWRLKLQRPLQVQLLLASINSFDSNEASPARRGASLCQESGLRLPCSLMMPTRLAVGLEPLNAPDAAHRSPRFRPPQWMEFGSPVGTATRRPLSETKNWRNHLIESIHSQASSGLEKDLPVSKCAMDSHSQQRWRS